MSKQQTTKSGFTIIEVVLVLAIAGLIFLMVFLALPALQRSQRDTQRRDDLGRFQTQITNYQTNNRGRLPGNNASSASTAYAKFMIDYLWAGGDEFVDPDGELYVIGVICTNYGSTQNEDYGDSKSTLCAGSGGISSLETAKPAIADTNPLTSSAFAADDDSSSSQTWAHGGSKPTVAELTPSGITYDGTLNHAIYIYQNGACDGESVVQSTGTRKFAIQYKLEGGGIYCGAN